uniref:Glutathione synthetase n=1 Tax=Opuntia streptacantha TaxID=393608 RepID=A0A7C9D973_OPUST
MGIGCSTLSTPSHILCYSTSLSNSTLKSESKSLHNHTPFPSNFRPSILPSTPMSQSPIQSPLNCGKLESIEAKQEISGGPVIDPHGIDPKLLQKLVYDALVWSSLHGLVVGDRAVQRSGTVPGVGMVHAPVSLLPVPFPASHWRQACELAPIFNELFDRVSLDAKFLQDSLSRTRKVDEFTSRLLDIHSKMIDMNKKEDIRLGLHRSDYMLDAQTKLLLQIEFNTISSSFPGLSCLVSELHRNLLDKYGSHLGLNSKMVPENFAVHQFAKALTKAWEEFNNPRAVVLVVVQPEERNMYDQHWLSAILREKHGVTSIRKTLAEIEAEAKLLPDGTLVLGEEAVAVVYFRAGYAPSDYPSDSEWRARLVMEQSSAVKCPSIAYHLAGTKKIQQELAKPNVLERFLDNKEDIAKLRRCFAGLWSLDDSKVISDAIEKPELYVMKPQREGGGNNIYGNDVRDALQRIQKGGTEEDAAYILMQRIFPTVFPALLVREGICHKDLAVSELGIYGAYLRSKDKILMNEQSGYLMRTKVSSSNEGGVAAGFAVLDSLYLT